ncbi:hypothetical protein PAL_GLEAN10010389 [Pteropus alecto]|uniref:Uncharacterized protein n=1 Tax=Pteropus alecto TaxID=9402 RepID=L5KJZ6_PTEAL|nr:hypothetical protein PAL_GLEAN10010389 [Pteropus alecto]
MRAALSDPEASVWLGLGAGALATHSPPEVPEGKGGLSHVAVSPPPAAAHVEGNHSHADTSPIVVRVPRSHVRDVRAHLRSRVLEAKSDRGQGHSLQGDVSLGGHALTWATSGAVWVVTAGREERAWRNSTAEPCVTHAELRHRHPTIPVNPPSRLRSDEDADSETEGHQSMRDTQRDDTPLTYFGSSKCHNYSRKKHLFPRAHPTPQPGRPCAQPAPSESPCCGPGSICSTAWLRFQRDWTLAADSPLYE